MNTQVEHLENHTARLTVDVDKARVEKAMQAAARKLAGKYQIPGFRKGKAPYNIILQRFGVQNVLSEAIDDIGNEVYKEALEETKIEPYAPGSLEDIKTEPDMRMVFVVPKRPEVELGDYRAVRVDYEVPEVTDEQVEKGIKSLQERRAKTEVVERAATVGDQVKVLINATVTHPASESTPAEGEEQHEHTDDFMKDEEIEMPLAEKEDDDQVMPGFSKELVGASAGETREFTIAFPDDYKDDEATHFAGHTYKFTVEVKSVSSRELPALDDEFAKTISEGELDTLDGLREDVRKQLTTMQTRDIDNEYSNKVLDQIVAGATLKYPEEAIDEYIHELLESLDQNLRQRGLSLDAYKRLEKKTDEDLHHDYREPAIKRLERSLALSEVVTREELTVTEADLERQIDQMSLQFGEQAQIFRQMLNTDQYRTNIANDLITSRAMKRLVAIGRGDNPPIGPDPIEETAAPVEVVDVEAVATEAPAAEAAPATTDAPAEASSDAPAADAE